MARHYSLLSFFRQMPNALLARYFATHGLFTGLDIAAMGESKPAGLLQAWAALDDEPLRRRIEVDFREIAALSDAGGLQAILDEAEYHLAGQPEAMQALRDRLAGLPDHHSRAMVTFLDHPEVWNGAVLFHHADSLAYWRKRKNLPRRPAAVDQASLQHLTELIKSHFRTTDGRGRHCSVETLRRGERDYFFAYPEDHSDRAPEWVRGELDMRPHNPAFEIVFIYSQAEGTLEVNARGLGKSVAVLQEIFAQAILKLDRLPPDPKDDKVYTLEALRQRNFVFVREPAGDIGTVVVKRLRLSSTVVRGDRLTIEADPTGDRLAVYDLMDEVGRAMPLHQYRVDQVDLAATVTTPKGRLKTRTIRIAYPHTCSLKHEDIDGRLRAMLVASGIEPRSPQASLD